LVYGNDSPTRDGTRVRDYMHVVDLAKGHLAARAFEPAAKRPVPYGIVARRPGDIAEYWVDPGKAWRELGWKAEEGLDGEDGGHLALAVPQPQRVPGNMTGRKGV